LILLGLREFFRKDPSGFQENRRAATPARKWDGDASMRRFKGCRCCKESTCGNLATHRCVAGAWPWTWLQAASSAGGVSTGLVLWTMISLP